MNESPRSPSIKQRLGRPVCCSSLACELSRLAGVDRPCAATALDVREGPSIEAEAVNLAIRADRLGFPSIPQYFAVVLDAATEKMRPTSSPLRYTVEKAAEDARAMGPHAVVAVVLRTADPECQNDLNAYYWHLEGARLEIAENMKRGLPSWEPTFVSVRKAHAA